MEVETRELGSKLEEVTYGEWSMSDCGGGEEARSF